FTRNSRRVTFLSGGDLGARGYIPDPDKAVARDTTARKPLGDIEGRSRRLHTPAARDALSVIHAQAQPIRYAMQSQGRCWAGLHGTLGSLRRELTRLHLWQPTALGVSKQLFERDQAPLSAQTLTNHSACHRSHPEKDKLKLLLMSGKSAMMLSVTANGKAGQF